MYQRTWYAFLLVDDFKEALEKRNSEDVSVVVHQWKRLTGMGVEVEASAIHFYIFFFSFFPFFIRTHRVDDAGVCRRVDVKRGDGESQREREKGRTRAATEGRRDGTQEGEIVQCQGYIGARAQNRPYTQKRGSRAETGKEGEQRTRRE